MKTSFIYNSEKSIIGTDELVISGLSVDGRRIALTGAVLQIERFGVTAEELALFAGSAESVHFVREFVSQSRYIWGWMQLTDIWGWMLLNDIW